MLFDHVWTLYDIGTSFYNLSRPTRSHGLGLLGQLLHVQDCEELYETSWRPTLVDAAPPFPAIIPPAPSPSPSVQAATAQSSPARPLGAYIPPGARGQSASLAYNREEDALRRPTRCTATPTRQARTPVFPANGHGSRRYVPGAAATSSPPPNTDNGKPRKCKGPKEKGAARGDGGAGAGAGTAEPAAAALVVDTGDLEAAAVNNEESVPPTSGVEPLDPV
jgi:translation initiation factor 2A